MTKVEIDDVAWTYPQWMPFDRLDDISGPDIAAIESLNLEAGALGPI